MMTATLTTPTGYFLDVRGNVQRIQYPNGADLQVEDIEVQDAEGGWHALTNYRVAADASLAILAEVQ